MNPSKALEKFIHQHVAGLCVCMNLSHFNIKLNFCKTLDCTMDVSIDHRYLEAKININTKLVTELWKSDKPEILACIAHELSHLITSEMSDPFACKGRCVSLTEKQIHFEERVTETVSRMALRLYLLENGL